MFLNQKISKENKMDSTIATSSTPESHEAMLIVAKSSTSKVDRGMSCLPSDMVFVD